MTDPTDERKGVGVWLLVLGTLLIVTGIYYLMNPSISSYGSDAIVNLQRLTIGETASIAGAILVAAGAVLRYK